MLSFIISNVLIVANAAMGVSSVTTEKLTVDLDYQKVISQAQELKVTGKPLAVSRDNVTVELTPAIQTAGLGSQIVTQSLPASSSGIIGSASKYLGVFADCTWLVEQALRDMGYAIGDVGPTGFGSVGTVFYDSSQVQPGDIMMRGGHVAIYAGDGIAIQGGWNGFVAIASDSPNNYGSFVRLG